MLAEDSVEDAKAIKLTLREAGVGNPLFLVPDGVQAINYFKGEGAFSDREKFPVPEVLLLDLSMPKADGFEVLKYLQSLVGVEKLLVIVLSGHRGLDQIRRAYSLGANSFLFKPTNPDDIKNLIKAFPEYWSPSLPLGHELV